MTEHAELLSLAMRNADGSTLWSVSFAPELLDQMVATALGAVTPVLTALSVNDTARSEAVLAGDIGEIVARLVGVYISRAGITVDVPGRRP
ncbi:MAG: hypothetical protein WDO74_17095 [Pseudomonadota bacterium]